MTETKLDAIESQFRRAIGDCRELYRSAARECIEDGAALPGSPDEFVQLLDDLHRGLLIKIFACVAQADMRWTNEEARLAAVLIEHLWQEKLSGQRLRDAAQHLVTQGHRLKWYSLVRPFDQISQLRGRVAELETVVLRVANLVAKCDGVVTESEAALLRTIEDEIAFQLRPIPLDDPAAHDEVDYAAGQAMEPMRAERPQVRPGQRTVTVHDDRPATERLNDALRELKELIGIEAVKREVTTLTNYLGHQSQRRVAGLPTAPLSLHMVFTGNPGTGKTTVARILGRIFGAMGVLPKGHLIETDRSGLVAEYAGQTAPKTKKRIDEALGGVLFIDEAYGLVAEASEDPYGREAVQTLLKRMEDDRERLAVVLAGYPEPMDLLLRSNPGLASRFSTQLAFADYQPSELGGIFQHLCDKNHYRVPGKTQARLLLGFRWLYEHRDEHFGNGRLVRNIFERAIRRLANRIAGVVPVTEELLSTLAPEDIELTDVPAEVLARAEDDGQRFLVICPGCRGKSRVPVGILGLTVKCKACDHRFTAAWGEPLL
jgi:tellurite resistance protein